MDRKSNQTPQVLPNVLWRYLKPSWLSSGPKETIFDLRAGPPPEDYVSFFEGAGDSATDMMKSVLEILRERKFKTKPSAGMLCLCPTQAQGLINHPNDIIRFKEEGRPHFGLHYITQDETLIMEAKLVLEQISEIHKLHDYPQIAGDQ